MKQARTYETKVKKLLGRLPKSRQRDDADDVDPIRIMIEAVLQADSTPARAARAMRAIEDEYVDFNELRISPVKDVVECLGADYPNVRRTCEELLASLGGVYAKSSAISLAHLASTTKRDQRRRLSELGLGEYAVASVLLLGLDRHAIPVDRDLADCLEMDGYVHPGSDVPDIQKFLERIIPRSRILAAHEFFRAFVQKHGAVLAKKRKAERDAADKVRLEAEKRAAEEEKNRKEQEALAAAAAKKRAQKKRRKAASAKKAARAGKKKAARKAASSPRSAKKAKKIKRTKKTSAGKSQTARKAAAGEHRKKTKATTPARTKKK